MGIVTFSPKDLVIIGDSLNIINIKANNLKASLDGIKNVNFSYSSSTSSNVNLICDKVDEMIQKVNNLNTSYKSSSKLLLDLVDKNKDNLNNLSKDGVFTYNDKSVEEVIKFYFNYPEASEKIRPITEEELRSIFEKNGAKVFFNNKYEFEVDGCVYRYNVKYPYNIECYKDGKLNGSMSCNFFISTNTTFEDITNTITILCGTGTSSVPKALNDMNINPNTIVAIGYGNDGTPNMPQVTSGITKACNYLAGYNKTGSLDNSIVGYSLGGVAAFKTASVNPGLYSKIVTVNSASMGFDPSKNFAPGKEFVNDNDYDNLAGVEIIMVEANKDKFGKSAIATIKKLTEHGLGDNVSFYTNSSELEREANRYLGPNNVHTVPDDFANSNIGWDGHNNGFEMLLGINVFSYLSS